MRQQTTGSRKARYLQGGAVRGLKKDIIETDKFLNGFDCHKTSPALSEILYINI